MTGENTNKLNLFISRLYKFHFESHGGQLIVYLISFAISLGYMIVNGILLSRPQQNTVIEGLILGTILLIGLPIIYIFETIKLKKRTANSKENSNIELTQAEAFKSLEDRIVKRIIRESFEPYSIVIQEAVIDKITELLGEKSNQKKDFPTTSVDYYLKIDTIEGEADAAGFEKQMQIESWSFGEHNSGSYARERDLGVGKVSFQEMHFVVRNGKASPQLFLACARGNHIPQAILSCRKTGGDGNPYTYTKVTFGDIVISSFQTGASNDSTILPMEQISFNFTVITFEYFQQKADRTVALTNTVSYDVKRVEGTGA